MYESGNEYIVEINGMLICPICDKELQENKGKFCCKSHCFIPKRFVK